MNVYVLNTPVQLPKPNMEIVIGSREKLKHQADALVYRLKINFSHACVLIATRA
ncbi:binary cytotoxin component, partial [Pseudomonas syringae pv. actinidiae]